MLTLLSILTLNLWGLPDVGFRVLSPLRAERVAAVCERLRQSEYDLVLLQEVWVAEDRRTLRNCGFPHVVNLDEANRLLDSGLMILSRHPIERAERRIFVASPTPESSLDTGESLARKSVIAARVKHPSGAFWVANTHLVANYDGVTPDRFVHVRRAQLGELGRWTHALAGREPLIVGGDFNFNAEETDWLARLGRELPGFQQWAQPGACTLCTRNEMHSGPEERVDQIWASSQLVPESGGVAMDETLRIEDAILPLSDHFGWETRFRRVTPQH